MFDLSLGAVREEGSVGNLYAYASTGDTYTLRSLGADGRVSPGITFATRDDFDLDIVMKDGQFVNQPFTR